jgi:hypothetical protein
VHAVGVVGRRQPLELRLAEPGILFPRLGLVRFAHQFLLFGDIASLGQKLPEARAPIHANSLSMNMTR